MPCFRLLAVAIVCVVCVSRPAFAADLSFEEEATQQLQKVISGDGGGGGNGAGIAVLVARDGKIVFQGGFGFADIERKTPVTANTKFRIGSISKQFTAAAILKLAEQNKLSLDDPLAKYYPDFPRGNDVKLQMLLNHTSGLHSYTDKPGFIWRVKDPIEPAKLIDWFRNDPPDFEPGKGFHYNNSAYFLLGDIVAKVSGKPLGEYLRETFFDPLEMKDTGTYVNSAPPAGIANGYSFLIGKFEPALDWDMSWAGGAGALYSTVGDLFRWNEALFGGRVLSEASFQAATTPVELPADVDGMNYGYGLVMSELRRLRTVGHGGGLNGWSTNLVRLPDQKCTVVVLTNASPQPPQYSPAAISHALAERLLADEIKKLPPLVEDKSIDAKSFTDYVGRYDYQDKIMSVAIEDGALIAQLTGQPKNRIFPKAKDAFFWKVVDAEVVFLRDDQGRVVAARHTQGGNSFRAARIPNDAIQLTDMQVAPFEGQYRYGLFATMTVTRDGAQLFAQITGQPKYPIFPKSETEFEWRIVPAQVQFVKGEDGVVTKAVHQQNGTKFDAPKVK